MTSRRARQYFTKNLHKNYVNINFDKQEIARQQYKERSQELLHRLKHKLKEKYHQLSREQFIRICERCEVVSDEQLANMTQE